MQPVQSVLNIATYTDMLVRARPASDVPASDVGVTDPKTWDADAWPSDVAPHMLYEVTTAAVYRTLDR